MSIDQFNRRMIEIEAANREAFKGRRIFSYYELDPDKGTEKYIIDTTQTKSSPKIYATRYKRHLINFW